MKTPSEKSNGFKIERSREIGEISATLYEMMHEKTGAQLAWLAREDTNKTFGIGFRTLPEDETGVFHILEHSVLNGSDKYPTKEPFVDLLKGSLKTFLNAMTFPDKTFYPVSSRNDKDFLNLIDVYMDAVLHPAIYHKPEIFRQEGIHIELLDKAAEPIYKGVVFNEMKGAYASVDSVMTDEINHLLFPDTCYGFKSGGNPEYIPALTYERFIEFHKRFYHPSNSRIFLDGDMDINAVLEKLDSFLSAFEKKNCGIEFTMQSPVTPAEITKEYEIGASEDAAGKTKYATAYVYGTYADKTKTAALSILSSVLTGSNESPLKKAILSRSLAEDISMDVYDGVLQPWAIIDVSNTDTEKLPEIKKVIADELSRLVSEGIDKEELTAAINLAEFKAMERDFGSYPKGIVFGMSIYDTWLYGGDPAESLTRAETFTELRRMTETGGFEKLLREVLIDGKHKASVCLLPSKTVGEERIKAEAEKLSKIKASWTNEECDSVIAMNKALAEWQAADDTPEQTATLPKLALSDISEKAEKIPTEADKIGGCDVIRHEIASSGIVYLNLYFSENGLTPEQLSKASLLCELLTSLDTKLYDRLTLQKLIKTYLGKLDLSQTVFLVKDSREKCRPALAVKIAVLEKNLDKVTELIPEILKNTDFSSAVNIHQIIMQTKTALMQSVVMGGHATAVKRCFAYTTGDGLAAEMTEGYEYYRFCRDLDTDYDKKASALAEELSALCKLIFTRSRLKISVTATETSVTDETVRALAEAFPEGEACPDYSEYKPLGKLNEGIVIPAPISFAVTASPFVLNGYNFNGSMLVLSKLLSLGYLWNEVRVKGGAYGTGFRASQSGAAMFYSYRDPSAARSLDCYSKAAEYIKSFCAGGDELDKFVIGTIADCEPVLSVSMMASKADSDFFNGRTYEDTCKIRREVLSTTKEALLGDCDMLGSIVSDDVICVVGGKDILDSCGEKLRGRLEL